YETTDVQLLILAHTAIAPGNLPGKFFEYLASGNFILGLGPVNGDAAAILAETKAGSMIDRTDVEGIKTELTHRFHLWKKEVPPRAADVSAFTRKRLTHRLTEILASLRA
ncbi:MAG: glycosyl transferase, partial [Flammeovirgaceae bacterium]